jgi:hypothetical protein
MVNRVLLLIMIFYIHDYSQVLDAYVWWNERTQPSSSTVRSRGRTGIHFHFAPGITMYRGNPGRMEISVDPTVTLDAVFLAHHSSLNGWILL